MAMQAEIKINKICITPTNIHNAPAGRSWLYTEDRNAEATIVNKVAEEYSHHKQQVEQGFIAPETNINLDFSNDIEFKDACVSLLKLSQATRKVPLSGSQPNWDKQVYAFEMHATSRIPGVEVINRHVITGYITNCDDVIIEDGKVIGLLGNYQFNINNIFEVRSFFNIRPQGMEKSEVLASGYEIVTNPLYESVDSKDQLEIGGVEGVIRYQSLLDFLELSPGVQTFDLRNTINYLPHAISFHDSNPVQFVTKYFEALIAGKVHSDVLHGGSDHYVREMMYRTVRTVNIRNNPVLRAISILSETGVITSQFDLNTIRKIDPDVEVEYAGGFSNDWRSVTLSWDDSDPVTMFASLVTHLVTSRMGAKGWRDFSMEIKEERDGEGRTKRSFSGSVKSIMDNTNRVEDFEPLSQLGVEIAHLPFLSSYKNWTIGISASLTGTAMISINTDGDECIYASPTFASARFSPAIATSKDHVRALAECFNKLEDQFNERVN